MKHKISICECDTCREVKKRILNPRCSYCGEHHDSRIHCIAEMEQRGKDTLEVRDMDAMIEKMKKPLRKGWEIQRRLERFDRRQSCIHFDG